MTATPSANGVPPAAERLLHLVEPVESKVDSAAAEAAIHDLLVALGHDPESDHLRDTPRRVAAALSEMLTARPFQLTTFPNDEGYDELVVARDIPFHSLCEHHLLPFTGRAHVAYLPGERILGLSKLARVVELFSRRLQVQEVGVVLDAEHMCMSLRGVAATGSSTMTSALLGRLRDDPRTRSEFFALTGFNV